MQGEAESDQGDRGLRRARAFGAGQLARPYEPGVIEFISFLGRNAI